MSTSHVAYPRPEIVGEFEGDRPAHPRRGPPLQPKSIGLDSWRRLLARLVENSLGYRVTTASGQPLGRLAWLGYAGDEDRPATLMVRPQGWRGLWSRRERPLPFELVMAVRPGSREVIVMSEVVS